MRDRLIQLINRAKQLYKEDMAFDTIDGAKMPTETDYIIDYLLANGVIVPPVKVGDIVYVITTKRPCYACILCTDFCHKNCSFDDRNRLVIKVARVCGIESNGKINKVHLEIDQSKICYSYNYTCWFDDFGKRVFLTKEEAEKHLRGVQE